ncbi:MAG: hypothetical protein NVS9B3_16110 [Gemmatimonadaceae bacterium]
MVVAGIVMVTAVPFARDSSQKASVRGARMATANGIATARAAAVARGCRAVFHITQGAAAQAWVTACKPGTVGAVGAAVDTVGVVDAPAARYAVTITSDADSVSFDARGISLSYATATFRFRGASATATDSLIVNAVGRVSR